MLEILPTKTWDVLITCGDFATIHTEGPVKAIPLAMAPRADVARPRGVRLQVGISSPQGSRAVQGRHQGEPWRW